MKKLIVLLGLALALSSCEVKSNLYNWGNKSSSNNATEYESSVYNYYHSQSPESLCALLCEYEYMVTHPGGERGVVPPGICAEYGYLLLSPDTPQIFSEHATKRQKESFSSGDYSATFREKGMLMLQKEIELYPESAVFIQPLIKKFSQQ